MFGLGLATKIYVAVEAVDMRTSADGVVVVLDAGEKLNILARNKLDGAILATPALVDGKIYQPVVEA